MGVALTKSYQFEDDSGAKKWSFDDDTENMINDSF